MTYDLAMWSTQGENSTDAPQIYEQLCDGEHVNGLDDLPLDRVMPSVKERFPGIEEDIYELNWSGDDETLQVTWSPQHVHFECHGPSEDTLARLVQLAAEFNCVLYDPQAGELVKI